VGLVLFGDHFLIVIHVQLGRDQYVRVHASSLDTFPPHPYCLQCGRRGVKDGRIARVDDERSITMTVDSEQGEAVVGALVGCIAVECYSVGEWRYISVPKQSSVDDL